MPHPSVVEVFEMKTLDSLVPELQALLLPSDAEAWRWQVRQHLSSLKDVLARPELRSADAWLAAREHCSERQRAQLLARVQTLAAGVLDRLEADHVRSELARLGGDLERYRQRVNDLIYDSVELELGAGD